MNCATDTDSISIDSDSFLQLDTRPPDAPQIHGDIGGPARRDTRILLLSHRLADGEKAPGRKGVRQQSRYERHRRGSCAEIFRQVRIFSLKAFGEFLYSVRAVVRSRAILVFTAAIENVRQPCPNGCTRVAGSFREFMISRRGIPSGIWIKPR